MKTILIFGGTGFIGKHLLNELNGDYNIIVASRNTSRSKLKLPKSIEIVKLDYTQPDSLIPFFDKTDTIINLAGESVGSRWSKNKKQSIKNSRLRTDEIIIDVFNKCSSKPNTIIQGSGIGVYGFEKSNNTFTEGSPNGTEGFLTKVGVAHEQSLKHLEGKTRIIFIRTGLVLDSKEGALPLMALPFKFFVGGPVGNGMQWNSWIHIKDEVNAIRFLLENEKSKGPYNLTSPNPVTNKEFAKALGKALHRPYFFKVPASFLKLGMGEMADELLLSGLNIIPQRLIDDGFQFKFTYIDDALKDIYSN